MPAPINPYKGIAAIHAGMLPGWWSRQGAVGTALSSGGVGGRMGAGEDTQTITSVLLTPDFCGSRGSTPMAQSIHPPMIVGQA